MKPEIVSKRNLNSKHFDNGDGTFTMDAHLGHIHYKNKATKNLENVDCRFIPCDYGWKMRKNNYELEIPLKADGWFKFINSFGYDSRGKKQVNRPDEIVAIRALGLGKRLSGTPDNPFSHWHAIYGELIEKPEWKGKGIVLYKNAYGPDIDLEVMARNTGFVKEVVINKKPAVLLKDVEFAFEIDLGDKQVKPKKADYMNLRETKIQAFKGLEGKELLAKQKLYEDDLEREVWNKTSKLETSESIILEKLRKTWFRKFNLYDSEGNQGIIKVRLENINGKIILTKVLDKTFLENAVYPVRTDTTTSYYAGTGDGDVEYQVAGHPTQTFWNTAHDTAIGTSVDYTGAEILETTAIYGDANILAISRGFYPIDTSGLGSSAIISAAILKLYITYAKDDYNGSGYDYVAVVQTDQPSTTALTTADYNNCGAVNNPTKGSADWDISGKHEPDQYEDLILNQTGRDWIQKTGTTMLGVRGGHDIEDVFPGDPGEVNKGSLINNRSSASTDTNQDPYLSVTYTTGPAVKSINGIAIASIKSVNGVAKASIKSINGIT